MGVLRVSLVCDGTAEVQNCGVLNLVLYHIYLISDDAAREMFLFFTIFCFCSKLSIQNTPNFVRNYKVAPGFWYDELGKIFGLYSGKLGILVRNGVNHRWLQLNTYVLNRFEFAAASVSTFESAFVQPVCCAHVCVCVCVSWCQGTCVCMCVSWC